MVLNIRRYWVNEGSKLILIFFYFALNLFVFGERFYYYTALGGKKWKDLLGWSVVISRASGSVIKLNCSLILLPVLRNLLSWLRKSSISSYIPIDKNIIFHKYIGYVIVISSAIHVYAHYINFYKLSKLSLQQLQDHRILFYGSNPSTTMLIYTSIPGITGILLSIILIFIISTSTDEMRNRSYNLFWFIHRVYYLFFALICIHGMNAIIEKPTSWYYITGPLLFYWIESLIRTWRSSNKVNLVKIKCHISNVLELHLERDKNFFFYPGQYVYLCVPEITVLEWHPFTISSSTYDNYISLHIKIIGDWTGKLFELVNPDKIVGTVKTNFKDSLYCLLDGPYGSAAQSCFRYENIVFICCGIGITPFASILKTIRDFSKFTHHSFKKREYKIKEVQFVWITKTLSSLDWFIDALTKISDQCPFIKIKIYLTSNEFFPIAGEKKVWNLEKGDYPFKLTLGRPDLKINFENYRKHFKGKVGVFYCGPSHLSKNIYSECRKKTKGNNPFFVYHKENF